MEPHRLRAPKGDGTVLAEPPLNSAGGLLAANVDHLARWDYDFQGRRVARLRAMARSQVMAKAREHHARFGLDFEAPSDPKASWVVTGHQPEMFHPGVWVKNFAIAGIARPSQSVSLNLIVDNDIPKSSSLRVPTRVEGSLRSSLVDFDVRAGEVPYEDWAVVSESTFASFLQRARDLIRTVVSDPILDEFWPQAMRAAEVTDRAGLRFSAARRAIEGSWGVRNLEVPLGAACETEAFAWFACHLFAHLPRFQATHNAALARYRALYKIRSNNHPVPRLVRVGEWLEAPFWVWRRESPRRRPLFARQNAKTLDLRIAGESEPFITLRLPPDGEACCAVEDFLDLPRRGIRVRTRALTTTMFARLLLGDLFVHGIGGAKYDELGDEVMRGFFGTAPPGYLTLSMTHWLGLGVALDAEASVYRCSRELRDLQYNPERWLGDSDDPEVCSLISAKAMAIAGPLATRRQRVARFREIRRINEALASRLENERRATADCLIEAEKAVRENLQAMSREWALPLHSRSRWEGAMRRLVPSAFGPGKNLSAGAQA